MAVTGKRHAIDIDDALIGEDVGDVLAQDARTHGVE